MNKSYGLSLLISISLVVGINASQKDANLNVDGFITKMDKNKKNSSDVNTSLDYKESNSTKLETKKPEVYMSCYDILEEIKVLKKAQKATGELEGAEKYTAQAVRVLVNGGFNELLFGDQQKYSKKIVIKEKIKFLKSKLNSCSPY